MPFLFEETLSSLYAVDLTTLIIPESAKSDSAASLPASVLLTNLNVVVVAPSFIVIVSSSYDSYSHSSPYLGDLGELPQVGEARGHVGGEGGEALG